MKYFSNCIIVSTRLISLQPNMLGMLEHVYSHSYNNFMVLSDDVVKKARLMKPDFAS